MRALIVVSNHDPQVWSEEQKKGWDKIVYISFPNIPSNFSRKEVKELVQEYYDKVIKEVFKLMEEGFSYKRDIFFNIQGEYLFTILLIDKIKRSFSLDFSSFVFPTTERVVVEEVKEDGSVEKKSVFKFGGWR